MTVQPANKQHSNAETSRIKGGEKMIRAWSKGIAHCPHGLRTGCAAKGGASRLGCTEKMFTRAGGVEVCPLSGVEALTGYLLPSYPSDS